MARKEHIGHFPALVVCRSRIDGSREQIVLERVAERALFVTDHAWNDAHNCVGHAGRGQLSAREHEVADRNLLGDEMFANAVVDPFVVTAENDEVAFHRKGIGHRLVELFSVGRGENHFVVVTFGFECRDTVINGLALHHHTCESAIRVVVYPTMLVVGVVAQVVHMNFYQAFFLGASQDGGVQEAVEHFGNDGDDVDAHAVFVVLVLFFCRCRGAL